MKLSGKRALVTGAGRRVGAAIALELGRAGMRVAVHYHRSKAEAVEVAKAIVNAGGDAEVIEADLYNRDQAARLVDQVLEMFGGLDVLVPSAANFDRVQIDELNMHAWDRALSLNVTASFILVHRAARALRDSKGTIVFITCTSTSRPFRHYLPYVVSKGATRQMMRTFALELAPEVRVNAVAPGAVLPPEDLSAEAVERLKDSIPLSRIGSAEDVARAVRYLVEADFVTGHELIVDGGHTLGDD